MLTMRASDATITHCAKSPIYGPPGPTRMLVFPHFPPFSFSSTSILFHSLIKNPFQQPTLFNSALFRTYLNHLISLAFANGHSQKPEPRQDYAKVPADDDRSSEEQRRGDEGDGVSPGSAAVAAAAPDTVFSTHAPVDESRACEEPPGVYDGPRELSDGPEHLPQ